MDRAVRIRADGVYLEADWTVPLHPQGVIILVHGAGGSRFSRRNRQLAKELYDQKYATLLLDLMTPEEEFEDTLTGALRFDVGFAADRLTAVAQWVKTDIETLGLPVGYFATGTSAGAALLSAARDPSIVGAIVCRAGRPDLAGIALNKIKAPTLLIVGGEDAEALALNRWAYWRMDCERHLEIIRGAQNTFESPSDLAKATALTTEWFDVHLASRFTNWSSTWSASWSFKR
jgi:dienelactone hydrolase